MLGRKTTGKHHKAHVSTDTLKKIEARKKEKDVLNRSRTRAQKAEALIRYSKANREVKQSIRRDQRNFVDDLARQAEEAAGKGDVKEVYSITRVLAGVRKTTDRPVRAKMERCSLIGKTSEKGGQNTSGSCSTDRRQARCLT